MSVDDFEEELSADEIAEVHAFRSVVAADDIAMRRMPSQAPNIETHDEFQFYSWNQETTSLGVEGWLRLQQVDPASEADLEILRTRGYPKDGRTLVGLAREGVRSFEVSVLHNNGGIRIFRVERVCGSADDLWYPGSDWKPGVIFVAK